MIWTMPRPVLQWVAGLLAAGAAASFVMGIVNAPEHGGRLPGERPRGQPAVAATAINAAEATPLGEERIEAPPKPAEKVVNKTEEPDDVGEAPPPALNATPPAGATNTVPPVVTPETPPPETPAPPAEDEPPH